MLSGLIYKSYELPFGEARLYLRYDVNALLCLEREGLQFEDIFAEEINGLTLLKFLRSRLKAFLGAKGRDSKDNQVLAGIGEAFQGYALGDTLRRG